MKKKSLTFVSTLVLLASLLVVPVVAAEVGEPIGASFIISAESTEELDPSVAYNSQQREYLTVFWNDRSGNDDIRAERVSWNGRRLGGFWVEAGAGHDRRYPDVAYNAETNQYLVVWEDYVQAVGRYSIHGRLISATGQLISDESIRGVSVGTTPARPAVAYADQAKKFLVVWEEQFTSGSDTWVDIVGQAVDSGGTLSGSRVTISDDTDGHPRRRPDLAYNRTRNNYLVVFEKYMGMAGGYAYDIQGRCVGTGGTLSAFTTAITTSNDNESRPRVAAMPPATADGAFLVVWQDDSTPRSYIMTQLVAGPGTLLGSAHSLGDAAHGEYLTSAVAANEESRQFLVVVKIGTDPAKAQAISSDLNQWSGYEWLDSGPGADHPALDSGPASDFLVAVDRPPFGSRDIYGQLWGFRTLANLPLVAKNH